VTAFFRGAVALLASACALGACDAAFRFDDATSPGEGDGGGDEPSASSEGGSSASSTVCATDARCPAMRCETTSGTCVACLEDRDCSGALARCETNLHVCVACNVRDDCGLAQTCDVTTHRCLDTCHDADDRCPLPGFVCAQDLHLCIECRTSEHCASSTQGAVCDVGIGRCAQCTGNAQCPAVTPSCDRRTGRCVGCVSSTDCGAGAVCDPVTLVCRPP
jgi:hypothetical protein